MKTKTAVILAAGKGERLEKFETIKPLVKVGGVPLIVSTIERLQEAGIGKIFIVVSRGDSLVRRRLWEYFPGQDFFYIEQHGPQSMLGSVLSVEGAVREPFFVTVCDHLFEKNPLPLFARKQRRDGIAVLISADATRNSCSGANVRVHHKNGKIIGIGRDVKSHNALEAGIYHFGDRSLQELTRAARINRSIGSFEAALSFLNQKGLVFPVVMSGNEWYDVNTPATLIRAELFLKRKSISPEASVPPAAKYKNFLPTSTFAYPKEIRFDVHVGRHLIDELERHEIIPYESFFSPHHLIVDKNIDGLYGEKVYRKLLSQGYQAHKIVVDPGEWSKGMDTYLRLANEILTAGLDKKSVIISVGGGVIKDLAGFLASTLYRGIGFISIPTSLLAQCDAAIALKQGVNAEGGKNLLGSYYAPLKVVVDPAALLTLEDRYLSDGLAECLKQAFAQDRRFYDFLEKYQGLLRNVDFLEQVVRKSIALKISSIQEDFHEEGIALVNQYGHEVGHAVEYLSGYTLGHGEAVAVGMRVSAELAKILGIADEKTRTAQISLMQKYQLPVTVPADISSDDIIETLRYNKKFHGGEARFVLVRRIGELWRDHRYWTVTCSDKSAKEAIGRSYE